jgi:hypothetical protein
MRHRSSCERRCSYLVVLENDFRSADELRELATYLSEVAVSDFEVIIFDASSPEAVEENRRVLRWVGRHTTARPEHVTGTGNIDAIRAAIDLASCDKVIVADAHVRYSRESLDDLTALLELHEVVEPQDYFDPLPWWGGIEAGRILVHRSISPLPDSGSTFGFRKRAIRGLRAIDQATNAHDYVRRLASQGAEVFTSMRLFVRRIPPRFSDWIRGLPRRAEQEFTMPAKAALFFMLMPALIAVALLGGARMAGTVAGAISFASVALALRGRIGAGRFFPWRACFFAPLWVLQRSLSVYCALLWRVSGSSEPRRIPIPVRADGEQAASGK